MDDTYKINEARTEMREAYHAGSTDRLLAVFHADGFIDMSDGSPNRYGGDARRGLAETWSNVFDSYHVKFVPIVVQIKVTDRSAFDRGWLEFVLTPKAGGAPVRRRYRYVDIWSKTTDENWKITIHITNMDVPEKVGGIESTWFLSEKDAIATN
jgi:ketosteroid isomerase-like protein